MSLAERDQLILTIIFSIMGSILIVLIISFLLWRMIGHYRSKMKRANSSSQHHPPALSSYQRPQRYLSTKFDLRHQNQTKKRKKRANTNESAITLSFNPPHLINQNVKNLEKLFQNESTLTANSWLYEETLPEKNCYYTNSSSEPIYASSSTVLTSVSNLAAASLQKPASYSNELDKVIRAKQPLKYSQSCRQRTDSLPFDYYRSMSPSSTNMSNQNSLEPIYIRPSNATWMRQSRLAQLRDDTAILY